MTAKQFNRIDRKIATDYQALYESIFALTEDGESLTKASRKHLKKFVRSVAHRKHITVFSIYGWYNAVREVDW